jgi:hypothetical protein
VNSAGLPGTGLGGLFYILLALWMPVREFHETLRGRSSRTRWRQVGTQFALACWIIAAVGGTLATYVHLVEVPSALGIKEPTLALAPVLLAALLLGGLVVVLRVWARIQGPSTAPMSGCPARVSSSQDPTRGMANVVRVGQGRSPGPTEGE